MTIGRYFQIPEGERKLFIKKTILDNLPKKERDSETGRVKRIVEQYENWDVDALSVLAYASEQGKYHDFASRLEKHYKETLKDVRPEARRLDKIHETVKTKKFFSECYEALGV